MNRIRLLLATSLFSIQCCQKLFCQDVLPPAGDNTTEEEFNRILKTANRATRDLSDLPPSFSLKSFAPPVQRQGNFATCVAWSTAYAARTISFAIKKNFTSEDSIRKYSFSPSYLYSKIKRPADAQCRMGTNIPAAMNMMKQEGALPKEESSYTCAPDNWPAAANSEAGRYRISDFMALSDNNVITGNDILKAKKTLSEKKPVLLSLKCFQSLYTNTSAEGIWKPLPEEEAATASKHALCLVGYDDNKNGGAFEVMNSWGSDWGNKGFFWLSYEQTMKYGVYLIQMMDAGDTGSAEGTRTRLSGSMAFIKLDESIMPVKRTRVNARSIEVDNDNDAEYGQYRFLEKYPGGTAFKIKFTTTAPAYVYIFSQDDRQVVSRLFPYSPSVSAAINSSNATIYLPAETKHARLSTTPGKENICVLYAKRSIDLDGLLAYINEKKISISDALGMKFKNDLIPPAAIRFSDDRIDFSTAAAGEKLLCFFIQMEHD